MEDNCERDDTPHSNASFWDYLPWYHTASRYRLRQQWTNVDYADLASSEDEDTAYDKRAREGTVVEAASILDRVGTSLQTSLWLPHTLGRDHTSGLPVLGCLSRCSLIITRRQAPVHEELVTHSDFQSGR